MLNTGKLYAMKELNVLNIQQTDSIGFVMDERNFLADMDGNFVTNLKYSFIDRVNDKIYLVMDLMTGGDLAHHLSHDYQFEEERAKFYGAQILLGLEKLHKKNIIYRDLKLGNVLLDNKGYCKLTDLGLFDLSAVLSANNIFCHVQVWQSRKSKARILRSTQALRGTLRPKWCCRRPMTKLLTIFRLAASCFGC